MAVDANRGSLAYLPNLKATNVLYKLEYLLLTLVDLISSFNVVHFPQILMFVLAPVCSCSLFLYFQQADSKGPSAEYRDVRQVRNASSCHIALIRTGSQLFIEFCEWFEIMLIFIPRLLSGGSC